ncbi:MAG: type II toxin-antitoxin system VapC family toxin [Betaproteobacteria bacterium]|nr:type II toxin-antitoxin system VapC family toxin [Betaproteobacteria bacterium]
MIVLDTHVLVWVAADDRKLGRKTRGLIDRRWAAGHVAVAAITFWEVALLVSRGKLELPAPVEEWRTQLLAASLIELPIDGLTGIRAVDLDGLPDDPADRFIAATALNHGAALVTADEKLLRWGHALVRHDAHN